MSTNSKTTASLVVDTYIETPEVLLYVADDFREEARGTVTAVGLHSTRSLTLNVATDAVFNKENAIAIHSLSFLIAMRGFFGEKKLAFSFVLPSKPDELLSTRTHLHTFHSVNDGVNMIIRGQPFMFHEFGPQSVVVDVGDYRETFSFEIRRGTAPPQDA